MATQKSSAAGPILAGAIFGVAFFLLAFFASGDFERAAVTGLVAGFGFAILLFFFARTVAQGGPKAPPGGRAVFDEGETVLHEGAANHFQGWEGVGGWLYLTDRRLRFKSHAVNLQTHDESWSLGEIATVEATRTLGVIPNGLRVITKDGRRERFVVYGNDGWVAEITKITAGLAS